ncbi:hypothetical protein BB560_007252, partial [Smittium megazygosporum]
MEEFENKNGFNWAELGFSKEDENDFLKDTQNNSNSANFNLEFKDMVDSGSEMLLDLNELMGLEFKDVDNMPEFDFSKEIENIGLKNNNLDIDLSQDYINSIFNEADELGKKSNFILDSKSSSSQYNHTSKTTETQIDNPPGTDEDPSNSISASEINNSFLDPSFFNSFNDADNNSFIDIFKESSIFPEIPSSSSNKNSSAQGESQPQKPQKKSRNASLKKTLQNSGTQNAALDQTSLSKTTPSKSASNTPHDIPSKLDKPSLLEGSVGEIGRVETKPVLTKVKDSTKTNAKNLKSKRKATMSSDKKSTNEKPSKKLNSKTVPSQTNKRENKTAADKSTKLNVKNSIDEFYKNLDSPQIESNTNHIDSAQPISIFEKNVSNLKKNTKKSKQTLLSKEGQVDAKYPTMSIKQSSPSLKSPSKKRKPSKSRGKVPDTVSMNKSPGLDGYYNNIEKYLRIFATSFFVGCNSLLSEREIYSSLTNGVSTTVISSSCKNIVAVSWPTSVGNPFLLVDKLSNVLSAANTPVISPTTPLKGDSKMDKKSKQAKDKKSQLANNHEKVDKNFKKAVYTYRSSPVSIFKLTNVRPDVSHSSLFLIPTLKVIPIGHIYIDPNDFKDLVEKFDGNLPLSCENVDYESSSTPQIWWSDDGNHVALADSLGRLSIFEMGGSPSKWTNVLNKYLVYPVSSFLWVSSNRKYISTVSYKNPADSAKSPKSENINDNGISISLSRRSNSASNFRNTESFFFVLTRAGRLHMGSHLDKSNHDIFVDFSPPSAMAKLSGAWAITHSDIVQIGADFLENTQHFELLKTEEDTSEPHSNIYVLVSVHWAYFNCSKSKAEVGDSYIRNYIVCASLSSKHSMYIVASGELKIDTSIYKTTCLKLSPPIYFNFTNSTIPRLHRIIITQSKMIEPIDGSPSQSPQFESMLFGFDIVFEKNPIAEGKRLHKLRSLRVMHFKNVPSLDPEINFGIPIGIHIIREFFAIDYDSVSGLGVKPPMGKSHCPWVVYWSNGALTRYVKIEDKKGQPYETKIIVPFNSEVDIFSRCLTTCGTVVSGSTRYLRVNTSTIKDRSSASIVNCGNLELFDIEVFRNSQILVETQLFLPVTSASAGFIKDNELHISYETMVAGILASRILNQFDASDVLDALVKRSNKQHTEINFKNILSLCGQLICDALQTSSISLSPLFSNSQTFVPFFGMMMKLLSLILDDSLVSSTLSILLHFSSVSSAYSSTKSLLLSSSSKPLPVIKDDSLSHKVDGEYLLNYSPFYIPSNLHANTEIQKSNIFYPLSFDDWQQCYSRMLSQASWCISVITFLYRDLYLLFHTIINKKPSDELEAKSKGSEASINPIDTPSRIVILANLDFIVATLDCFKLISHLQSDISLRNIKLSRIGVSNIEGSWNSQKSFVTIANLMNKLSQFLSSLPVPLPVMESFFLDIHSIIVSNIEHINSLTPKQNIEMLLSGIVNPKLDFLVPVFLGSFTRHASLLQNNSFAHQQPLNNSSPSQNNDTVGRLLNYNTICTNLLGCYSARVVTFTPSRPTVESILKYTPPTLLSEDSDNTYMFLWVNQAAKPEHNNLANSALRCSGKDISPEQLPNGASLNKTSGINTQLSVSPTNFMHIPRPLDGFSTSNSPMTNPLQHSGSNMVPQSLFDLLKSKLIKICPSVEQSKFNTPFIDSVTKEIIPHPVPAMFYIHTLKTNDVSSNSIARNRLSVYYSKTRVCSNCWQVSVFHPRPLENFIVGSNGEYIGSINGSQKPNTQHNHNHAVPNANVSMSGAAFENFQGASVYPQGYPNGSDFPVLGSSSSLHNTNGDALSSTGTVPVIDGHLNGTGPNALYQSGNQSLTPGFTADPQAGEPALDLVFKSWQSITSAPTNGTGSPNLSNESVKRFYNQWERNYDKN